MLEHIQNICQALKRASKEEENKDLESSDGNCEGGIGIRTDPRNVENVTELLQSSQRR